VGLDGDARTPCEENEVGVIIVFRTGKVWTWNRLSSETNIKSSGWVIVRRSFTKEGKEVQYSPRGGGRWLGGEGGRNGVREVGGVREAWGGGRMGVEDGGVGEGGTEWVGAV